jgi:hypothetical protein
MATQVALISIGVSMASSARKNGAASATIVTALLEQPQPYSGGTGISQSASSSNKKLQLPTTQVIGKVNADGTVTISKDWFRFFHDQFEQRLGGTQGDSIPDITSTVVDTRAQAINAVTAVSSVSQQVDANAQALGAVVQVTQTNSLAGAKQIPPVVYNSGPNRLQN